MEKTVNVYKVDSRFSLFTVVNSLLEGKTDNLDANNLIFCEDKLTLMIEKNICEKFNGSFNTKVFSFGKFLHSKVSIPNVLTKEGSIMAVKRIIENTELESFKHNKKGLSVTVYELIQQLKSANVTTKDLKDLLPKIGGILNKKLKDICAIYEGYNDFLIGDKKVYSEENPKYYDQNNGLNMLPDIIDEDESLENADVIFVGYSSFTAQARRTVKSLIKKAKSVNAVLVGGDNKSIYQNETILAFKTMCEELESEGLSIRYNENACESELQPLNKFIRDNLFLPKKRIKREEDKTTVDSIFTITAENTLDEVERVGEIIKSEVINNHKRYRDFTIAVPDTLRYADDIESVFSDLDIPYFLDKTMGYASHPLTRLILSYYNAKKRGLRREEVCEFFKNPIISGDKQFSDCFENYLIKFGINYKKILEPFSFVPDEYSLSEFESFREKIVKALRAKTDLEMLEIVDAERVVGGFTYEKKNLIGASLSKKFSDFNSKSYQAISGVLSQIDTIIGETKIDDDERKNLFMLGIYALEVSVLPQQSDAVFIGLFKESSNVSADTLFMLGLTEEVPTCQQDVALLSDNDILAMEMKNVTVEPKIQVVNRRARESVGIATFSFRNALYLSYPKFSEDGKQNNCSEVITSLKNCFNIPSKRFSDGYLTERQALNTFAKDCGNYFNGENVDFSLANNYYFATELTKKAKEISDGAQVQIINRLNDGERDISIVGNKISVSALEEYYHCPYKMFLKNRLGITDREAGELNSNNTGNFAHDILRNFMTLLSKENDFDNCFLGAVEKTKSKDEYKRFFVDNKSICQAEREIEKARKFCKKMFALNNNSCFKTSATDLEVSYKDSGVYRAIDLGGVKAEGVIDRIGRYNDKIMVVDYKTTKNLSLSNTELYTGLKMQLPLYANAVLGGKNNEAKNPNEEVVGMYYFPIKDDYIKESEKSKIKVKGITVDDDDTINELESVSGPDSFLSVNNHGNGKTTRSREDFDAVIDYSKALAKKGVDCMTEGFIMPTPSNNSCKYCQYKGICDNEFISERKNKSVKDDYFKKALENETNEDE